MALMFLPLLFLMTGCGGAVLATVNKEGKEYTTGVITAQSNKHKTPEEAIKDIQHAVDSYCQERGGGYEFIDKEPAWDPVTTTPVIRYDKCRSSYEKGVDSCDRYTVDDGYILRDEARKGCWVMYDCKEIVTEMKIGDTSGSQRFRCLSK